ncbi:tryptophan dimethylallyltransferase family protein [Streptomyces sp. NPDC049555]|uniref:tryptophan dimethylallyltransferase family protein n=1 Tax=Streptomyces sp. NPDC049555 TaxID=3154930 RepID=UPI00341FBF29
MDRSPTARAVCTARLVRLLRALGLADRAASCTAALRAMTGSWGTATVAGLGESDVSSDGSPLEFAVGFDDTHPSLQFAVEPLAPGHAPADRAAAARHTMAALARHHGASADRHTAVADLFLPAEPATDHVAMYGAEVAHGRPVQFKVWFYLAADRPLERCARALEHLGLGAAHTAVAAHVQRDERRDRPFLFSLDLVPGAAARVKVYFRHYEADTKYMATLMEPYPGFSAEPVADFCTILTDGRDSLAEQAPATCLTFTGTGGPAVAATLYLPMWTYAPHDEAVRQRFHQVLATTGRTAELYDRVLREAAARPLDSARGIHNYIAWRPGRLRPRLKVYLSPELRHTDPATRYALEERAGTCHTRPDV